jgi:divalent metal cation (Fe/Co/Zn/Cd) transporter
MTNTGSRSDMPLELPTIPAFISDQPAVGRDEGWPVAARRARWLSYLSLGWMLAEGALGVLAGAEAHSTGVIAWAVGSAVEAAAAVIVIVRLTGRNRFSETSERRAQKWVAASLFLLVPYILYVAIAKLINGSEPDRSWLAVVLLGSSIVLMPVLGCAKRRLGERLGSRATADEGTQNLLCAAQGAIALVGLLLASAGARFLDPVAALLIAGLAAREGIGLWRSDGCARTNLPGFSAPNADGCADESCGRC